MGSTSSKVYYGITEEMLTDYLELTYLSRNEIISLAQIFASLHSEITDVTKYRFPFAEITLLFPQLNFNPFKDRICKIFSSENDECFSFEDMLDLCSAMSENCPVEVKASWAFRIYDFNDDQAVGAEDIKHIIDRLTRGYDTNDDSRNIDEAVKNHICDIIMNEIDIDSTGSITQLEFEHGIGKMSEFAHSFSFRT